MSKLSDINAHLEALNGKVFAHITSSDLHQAGLVKLESGLAQAVAIAQVAHKRVDKLEVRLNTIT